MKYNADGSVCVRALADVLEVIKNVMPGTESEVGKVTATFEENGKKYVVTAPSQGANDRDLLIEGFNIIKKRMEISQKVNTTVSPVSIDGYMWLDNFIKRRLGGVRDGLRVKWTLNDGVYAFDPFNGKLLRC